jgi:hypothetical protein
MSRTMSQRLPHVRLAIFTFGVLIAAWVSAPAVVLAHAKTGGGTTAGRTVALTLACTNASCRGSWFWYQGGLTSPAIGSGSISGNAGKTTTETTTQPAAADTLDFAVGAGTGNGGCGHGFIEYFTPGSAINFTATVPSSKPGDYGRSTPCSGAGSTFTMQS